MRWWRVVGGVLVAGLLQVSPAHAWSELGHRLVAELAEQRLSREARAEVRQLLAEEGQQGLGGIASWADALRQQDPPLFKVSQKWHFINPVQGNCAFVMERDCPDGECIVAAINAQWRLLADRSQPQDVRRNALKFVVHFVGDLHQPLHSGGRDDRGGNAFQVNLRQSSPAQRAGEGGRTVESGTNLHTVWDSRILGSAGLSRTEYAQRLQRRLPRRAGRIDEKAPLAWARETCELVEKRGIYPDARVIGEDYLEKFRPLAEERIAVAAVRLAALLEKALGSR